MAFLKEVVICGVVVGRGWFVLGHLVLDVLVIEFVAVLGKGRWEDLGEEAHDLF